jgi:hypothetical protein
VLRAVVDDHLAELRREVVAHDPEHQVEVAVQQAPARGAPLVDLDVGPQAQQVVHVAADLAVGRRLRDRADDEAGARRAHLVDQLAQALALALAGDPPRDADVADRRHEHDVAARQRDVRGDARALAGDRVLDDLDQDLLAGADQLGDVGVLAGAPGDASPSSSSTRSAPAPAPPGAAMSPAYRNAAFSSPMSTKAACMPGRTRRTLPLYTLPTVPRSRSRST